ncbi:MAG: hypothetical protein WCQ67_10275 [Treponema sp.]
METTATIEQAVKKLNKEDYVSVINYIDFLNSRHKTSSNQKDNKASFFGSIKLSCDPLQMQQETRNEWK